MGRRASDSLPHANKHQVPAAVGGSRPARPAHRRDVARPDERPARVTTGGAVNGLPGGKKLPRPPRQRLRPNRQQSHRRFTMFAANTFRIHLAAHGDAFILRCLAEAGSRPPLEGRVLIGEIEAERPPRCPWTTAGSSRTPPVAPIISSPSCACESRRCGLRGDSIAQPADDRRAARRLPRLLRSRPGRGVHQRTHRTLARARSREHIAQTAPSGAVVWPPPMMHDDSRRAGGRAQLAKL